MVVQIQETTAPYIDDSLARAGLILLTLASRAEAVAGHEGADPLPLEVDLRHTDDLEICRMLRSDNDVTIVAISRRGKEQDRAPGPEIDATSSGRLTVALRELLAGTADMPRATTPAKPPTSPDDVLQHGTLRIDLSAHEVRVRGKHVKLTRKEFDLLYHLASRPKQVIRREQLMAEIWGYATAHAVASRATRTIDTHVNSLRTKLGCRSWVETVRGVGFRFVGAPEEEQALAAISPDSPALNN